MGKQKAKNAQKRDILDSETLQYYRRISHELKQEFDDDENKGRREIESAIYCYIISPHVMMCFTVH